MLTGSIRTSSAYAGSRAPVTCSRALSTPSCGVAPATAACRAPSAAAEERVLRTCSTRASCSSPMNSGSSTTRTMTKSTTAEPRSPRRRTVPTGLLDLVERRAEQALEGLLGEGEDGDGQSDRHHRDHDPAGNVAPLVAVRRR